MLEPKEIKQKNHSIFDSMSTEELETILKADAQFFDGKDSNTDTILYIMEVIAKREKEHPTGRLPDVKEAWASFENNYLPDIENANSIYDFDDFASEHKKEFQKKSFKQIVRHRATKFVSAAAICIAVIVAGSITANAYGLDLFGAVAKWTKDTFGFSALKDQDHTSVPPDSSGDAKSFQDILDQYGITTDLVPQWLPGGYLYKSNTVYETPMRTTLCAIYNRNDEEITLTITSVSAAAFSTFEKDDEDVIAYTINEIDHYIMTNLELSSIVWIDGTYECSIAGAFSTEEAKKMIDSIYASN